MACGALRNELEMKQHIVCAISDLSILSLRDIFIAKL
jgi:hypothetical protein